MISVAEIMTENVITLQGKDTILTAMSVMAEKKIRHIPIVDKQHQLIGVISHRDMLRVNLSTLGDNADQERAEIEATALEDIMSTQVHTATPQDSLISVGKLLQSEKIGCMPIVEDGLLVGIITDSDFVGAAITLIEELEDFESNAA